MAKNSLTTYEFLALNMYSLSFFETNQKQKYTLLYLYSKIIKKEIKVRE